MVSSNQHYSVVSDSLWPHGLYSSCNSPGQTTGVGSLSLIQGIFPTRGSNSGLPHCRWILHQVSLSLYPNLSLVHLFWHLLCPGCQTLFPRWGLSWSQDRHKKELRYHICKLAILTFYNKYCYQYIEICQLYHFKYQMLFFFLLELSCLSFKVFYKIHVTTIKEKKMYI